MANLAFHKCAYMLIHDFVWKHSQLQLIKCGEKIKTVHRDAAKRRGSSQVADRRCSRAEEQPDPDVCGVKTTKQDQVLRQSLTAESKRGGVTLELKHVW